MRLRSAFRNCRRDVEWIESFGGMHEFPMIERAEILAFTAAREICCLNRQSTGSILAIFP